MKMFKTLIILLTLSNGSLTAQWQSDVRLTNNPAYSSTSENNSGCIAASGNVVHVVWYDYREGNYEIYYKRSIDGGVSFQADTRLTNNTASSFSPSVSVSGLVVHIVWNDRRDGNYEIYYKRSTDAGISWGADTRLTNNSAHSQFSSVAVSGSVVHVVWREMDDIYYKLSIDGGVSFGTDTRLTNNLAGSNGPSVSVSGSAVHVVWYDSRDGNFEIYYKRSIDGGTSWGADTRLTNNSFLSTKVSVSVSGSVLNVTWVDERDSYKEIYYKRSTDGGTSWEADTRLTIHTGTSSASDPSVSVSGSVVHVVWHDDRDGNTEIYYKSSSDGGVSFGADTRLTNNSAGSYYSFVSVSGSVVHVVWQEQRDGNEEIYYKRNPTGSQIPLTLNFTAFIEAFYNPVTNSMISDTVRVYLKNVSFPFNNIDSSKGLLSSSGTGNFLFTNAMNGVNYYLAVKHRNSIETWSSDPIIFVSGNSSYTFIALQSMAYGNNQIQIDSSPLRFGVYSGDVNQDGAIDLTDAGMINNDVFLFASGYLNTDLNSDGVVDLDDGVFTDNNSYNFVTRITP
ncbi:MAG TPA: hypothetical protein PK294_13115 [Ignavibacteria bacterium]|nr:hypothetical protein [Ignavibacteria bacterium]